MFYLSFICVPLAFAGATNYQQASNGWQTGISDCDPTFFRTSKAAHQGLSLFQSYRNQWSIWHLTCFLILVWSSR